ncbi:MAG TPA: UDP-glucose/GDP-mannose dehydrogenase family protein [Candidatus Saccharimonadales bacterium]|nr:UDP-glucose/GDP-mannose dehydrogenase family protein [Candidatus Saccharimonadales bacterium]
MDFQLESNVPVKIAVVGSGYVGLIAAVCFAEIGHSVICVDNDKAKVSELQAGGVPIYEEQLPELLARHRGKKLVFSSDLLAAARQAEVIFIAVGTPQSPNGEADLSYVEASVREIAAELRDYKVVVEKSTVPVLTNQWIRRTLRFNGAKEKNFDVISNPEFLREGTAIQDFLYPDRIVVGADTERSRAVLRRVYQPLIDGSYFTRADHVPGPCDLSKGVCYLETSAKSAELIKHASNAFLALKISFINAVANICEMVGTDVEEVALGIGSDSRIGSKFLNAGIGYGGSCFPKDVRAFYKIAESIGYDFELLRTVEQINEQQQHYFIKKLRAALWTLKGKHIGVLGLAFKGGTDDIRESPAINVIRVLLAEGCIVSAYDPAAMEKARIVMPESGHLHYVGDEFEAARDAHALLVLTEWPQFARLELACLRKVMRYPVVIDGRNLFGLEEMSEAGFNYYSMGRPLSLPKSSENAEGDAA